MEIERELEGLERDERALEKIADALDRLANIAAAFFEKMYPEKRIARRDALLTTVHSSEEDDLKESIQGSERTLEEWKELGPREREFVEKEKLKKSS